MGMGTTVVAPDGTAWRVRRRWPERPLPGLRRRWRKVKGESADVFDAGLGFDAVTGGVLGVVVVAATVVFVLALGIVLELLAVALLLAAGLFARVALRRPWIVVGQDLDDRERRVAFAVEGWRDSVEAT